ncbi:endolytic transglycosylase MltG, partial [Patescibacteria group bacterium]|nr:endolytic transglycosylase MltG [Patescibacteria group bacterium]
FLIILLVVFGGGFALIYGINSISSSNEEKVEFVIEEGEDIDQISNNLKEAGFIKSPLFFKAYIFILNKYQNIYPGKYTFDKTNAKNIINEITTEKEEKEITVTLLEGWTNAEIGAALEEAGLVTQSNFIDNASVTDTREIIPDKNYDFFVGKPADYDLEGFLFPDTYRFYMDSDSPEIIEKMLDNFDIKFNDSLRAKTEEAGMTPWEVVTLASIIEKEVRTADEKRVAAGIFLERLAIDKPLQSDATVNYITGKDTTMPDSEDLGQESLYNTYLNPGLPPGPICNPSIESISAVLNPSKTEYLYFLTTPDGKAVFSKTYEEHLENKYEHYPETKPE